MKEDEKYYYTVKNIVPVDLTYTVAMNELTSPLMPSAFRDQVCTEQAERGLVGAIEKYIITEKQDNRIIAKISLPLIESEKISKIEEHYKERLAACKIETEKACWHLIKGYEENIEYLEKPWYKKMAQRLLGE